MTECKEAKPLPLYDDLAQLRSRPLPFSQMTIAALWTDPHIARQMLAFHLNPDIDAASRSHATIDSFVAWLDAGNFTDDGRQIQRLSDLVAAAREGTDISLL